MTQKGNTPMAAILPIQGRFDKDIPDDSGNAEYRQERELLITIHDIISLGGLERPVIEYFLMLLTSTNTFLLGGRINPRS